MNRLLPTVLIAVALSALGASPASAGLIKKARFDVTISGTYASTGSVTNSTCFRYDDNNRMTRYTATGNARDTTRFTTTAPARIEITRTARGPLGAGAVSRSWGMRVTSERDSSLDSGESPIGCRPSSFGNTRNCGTKQGTFGTTVFGAPRGLGLRFAFVRNYSRYQPPDPFDFGCPLSDAQRWLGYTEAPAAAASPRKLFNKRVKRIVIRGTGSGAKNAGSASQGYQAAASSTFEWTMTLVRRR